MHGIEEKKTWREDEREEVSSYWMMTLLKGENTGDWNGKHYITLYVELILEEAMDLS
jgi:hypothetical protein